MSILVFDGLTLAADSQANADHCSFPFPKIMRVEDKLVGAIGPLQSVSRLFDWASNAFLSEPREGLSPNKFPTDVKGAQLLVVSKDKGVIRYNGSPTPLLHGMNKIAIGEGAPFAYGALHMGATAEQAVAAAIQFSPHCSGQPMSLAL